mgnify:CR=1 FL=1
MINTEYDNVVEAILGLEIEDIQKLNALDDKSSNLTIKF